MSQKKQLGKPQLYKPAYFNEILLQVIPAIDTRNQQGLQTTLFKHIRQRLYRQAKSVAFPLTFQPKVRFFLDAHQAVLSKIVMVTVSD